MIFGGPRAKSSIPQVIVGVFVSHIFNVWTAYLISKASDCNACAVFALVIYYEATGITFVQLLQYGTFQYARLISSNPQVNTICRQQWNYITMPGIYSMFYFLCI